MSDVSIKTALVSVYHKEGLEPIVRALHELNVTLISTGGTEAFIQSLGIPVTAVESITHFPEILGGRVKTLHPSVFGGILSRRIPEDKSALEKFSIPEIDLVIVDLYPFEETVASASDEQEIIEKIDIGGISLIRAAAKNFKEVMVCASRKQYDELLDLLISKNGSTSKADRQRFRHQSIRCDFSLRCRHLPIFQSC
jgi:phosphoribosylaminoimidazolecarboxamide formyltransferase/IMP cyclohydrolase